MRRWRLRRVHPFRLHLRGHQQSRHALMLGDAREKVMLPALDEIIARLRGLAHALADVPMLARTHGQAATPTTMGQGDGQRRAQAARARRAHRGGQPDGQDQGAVGNYNAHLAAYPAFDWEGFARKFVEALRLEFNPTPPRSSDDALAELFDACARANTILIDLDRDIWGYVSLGYFKQRLIAGRSAPPPCRTRSIHRLREFRGQPGARERRAAPSVDKLPLSRWQRI